MFPTPYPNEDFRSLIYRYHYYILGTEYSKTIHQLFDIVTMKVRHLPRNLDHLISKLPNTITAEYLLQETTLFYLIGHFCGKDIKKKIMEDIACGKKNNNSAAGILSGRSEDGIFNENYRYCIHCLNIDFENMEMLLT